MEEEQEALKKRADKERKEFDFAKEYSKNKAEYNRDQVVGAINDLIAGKSDLESTVDKIIKDGRKLTDKAKEEKKGTEKKAKKSDKEEK